MEIQTAKTFIKRVSCALPRSEATRLEDMLELEARLWGQGFLHVAGVDEAGRGPIAGPIVAAAVVLAAPLPALNDSKRLSAACRKRLYAQLLDGSHQVGVATVSAQAIDAHGIQRANYGAMLEAIAALPAPPDFVLVDGYALSGLALPAMRVIKGDARSLSIAAASVVAKVTRDTLLEALHEQYPQYGFARHKGYGTREHLDALARHGPCPEHRRSFAPLAIAGEESFLV